MILFTGAFAAAAFVMAPVYRATAVMVPAAADRGIAGSLGSALGQLGGLASLAGITVGSGDSQTEEALAVLRSREFTEDFIRDQRLMPELFSRRWDQKSGQWRGNVAEAPTLAQAFKLFDESVRTVSQDKKTGLITLRIDWKDPQAAANWANALIARLNAEMRARAIAKSNASMGYLQKELAATSTVETRDAIGRLMEAQITQRMLANVTEDYALRVVDKALPPDPDDVLRPNKPLLVALGLVCGLMLGVFAVNLLPTNRTRS